MVGCSTYRLAGAAAQQLAEAAHGEGADTFGVGSPPEPLGSLQAESLATAAAAEATPEALEVHEAAAFRVHVAEG